LGPLQWIQALLVAAAALLLGILSLAGVAGVMVSLSDAPIGWIFVVLGVFVLGFGVVADGLLPRVSEKSILVTQLLVIFNELLAIRSGDSVTLFPLVWFLVLGLPAGVMLYLAFNPRPVAPLLKTLLYLWYLASLLVLSFQNGAAAFFESSILYPQTAFAFGATFIFLLLHGLFAIRFFLIASSTLLPRNRPPVRRVMQRLFADDQISPRRFTLFALGIAAVLALNAWLLLFPRAVLLNLVVIASVQLFFNPRRAG
jgi:hypothetical protein